MADPSDPTDNPPATALMVRQDTAAAARSAAPEPQHRDAVGLMLQGAVEAFGDVVTALLCDLDTAETGLAALSWLSSTQGVLDQEQVYQAAMHQLQWWDGFLEGLPDPELISERRRPELRKLEAQRARARLQAREAALAEHRRQIEAELAQVEVDEGQATAILQVHQDPQPGQWRVDVVAWEEQALAALPPTPVVVPIVPQDLDAAHSFAGFNAVAAMRAHPQLAGRAAHLDASIAATLVDQLGLPRADAERHAPLLTGMFWIAMRRALGVGSHQLAISIQLLSRTGDSRVREQFTRELLTSWLAYLDTLPQQGARRLGVWSRLRLRLGMAGGKDEPASED